MGAERIKIPGDALARMRIALANDFHVGNADKEDLLFVEDYKEEAQASWKHAERICILKGVNFEDARAQFLADIEARRDPSVGDEVMIAPVVPGM